MLQLLSYRSKNKFANTQTREGIYLLILLMANLIFFTNSIQAQSLEKMGKGDAIGVSGGVNVNNVFYSAQGIEGRRSPHNYFISGNLNFNLYDWSVPLSFSYSDQDSRFQQPFNQYGMSPNYKWLTLHAGYRSMNFSNFTMSGHLFLGGGADVVINEKFKISGFYGRLQKAVEGDTTQTYNLPSYQRLGGGVKVTVGSSTNYVDIIVFKAKDNERSLENSIIANDVAPQENLVLSLGFGTTLMEKLTLTGEVASSAISKDIRAGHINSETIYDRLRFAYRPRVSSAFYQAYKSNLIYTIGSTGIGLVYERIDPGYRTLGAYYFNNNLESFAFTNNATFFEKKARINWRLGLQRNNLDKKELSSMNRLSGSMNLNYLFSPNLVFSANYSNFQTVVNFRSQFDYINQVSPYENLDTLNYRQISQNANFNANYSLTGNKVRKQNINMNLSYQETTDIQANINQPTGAQFYNINTSYSVSFSEQNLTVNIAANGNISETLRARNAILGPTLAVRKGFFEKKISTKASISYNNAFINGTLGSKVINLRLSGAYTLMEKHNFNLSLTRINRFNPQNEAQPKFSELTIQVGYNYNFSLL